MPAAHNRREGPGRLRNRHPLSGNNVKSDSPAETNHIEHEKIADERAKEETIKSMETDPLLKRLHSIVQHQEELLHKQNTTEDWHFVAIVIDRCLFWLYLLMMLSSTIGCLVIFPLTKEYAEDFDKPDHPS
ncbi:hypothetical protein EB796_022447 [Bugula neritina]|uniref:Neurotransmitter-gated ion-channel transmembrane domain-containing protein n=1 Tax=Bugula neritina TaxID=10212 RepID=A0A7J7J0S3_BUGNE|nr:hypothetical protein EB796_022447 [Bugula neritina]